MIYNLVLSAVVTVVGLMLAIAPPAEASPQYRILGWVAAGYGVVRGYYFYRRLRSRPPG